MPEKTMAAKRSLPKVTIVTPSYNQAQYIERTINSIQMQDYPNIEHIVIDGKSTDGTVEILKKYPKMRWVSEKDGGHSNAMNKGFRMAKGEIIGWMNSDDTYCEGAVRAAADYFIGHPDVDIIYSRVNVIDENDRKIGEHALLPYNQFIQINVTNCVPQQGVFFRKKLLSEIGYIDEGLKYVMDYEFWIRIGQKKKIVLIPGIYSNFRIAKGTKTAEKYDAFFDEILAVNRKYGGFPYIWMSVRAMRRIAARLGLLGAVRGLKNGIFSLAKKGG